MISGIRKTKGWKWIILLKNKGISKFIFNELSDDLKDKVAFRQAAADELIKECRKLGNGVKEWEVTVSNVMIQKIHRVNISE